MADSKSQHPTIPVKKQDGSIVRMTLDELKRYTQQQAQAARASSSASTPSVVSPLAVAAKSAQVKPIPKKEPVVEKQPMSSVQPPREPAFASLASLQQALQANAIDARPIPPLQKNTSQQQKNPVFANVSSLQRTLQKNAIDARVQPVTQSPSSRAPVIVTEQALSTTTPVTHAFVAEAAAHEWKKEDALSPLDDSLHTDIVQPHTPVSSVTTQQVEQVIARSRVSVEASLAERFRLAIIARLKGIRSNDETITYLTMEQNNGGVGLSVQQAKDVIKSILNAEAAPRVTPAESVITPSAVPPRPHYTPLHQPLAPSSGRTLPPTRQSTGARPIIQDIQKMAEQRAPQRAVAAATVPKQTVGPIDEIAQLRLADFRRLSRQPQQAAEQLVKKFDTLKKESYLLFLEAKKAWWHSPLFQQYVQSTVDALHANRLITQSYAKTPDAEALTQEEFQAVVLLNTQLG